MSKNDQINTIKSFVNDLRQLVDDLSPDELTTHYIEGEWTIAQVIHHLFDAHTNAYQLCKRVLTEETAKLSWTQQDELANLPDGRSSAIKSSLVGLEGLHMRWADMFEHVEDWSKAGISIKSGKAYTIAKLLEMYANHCDNHMTQIQELLNKRSSP